jgi:hypothetical protein
MLHKIPARYQTLGLFALAYILLYLIYVSFDFLPKWDAYGYSILHGSPLAGYLFVDPLFLGIPFVGFGLMFIAIRWALHTFKDEQILSVPFALGFVILSYVAYFMAMVMYYWNNAYLSFQMQGQPSPLMGSLGFTVDFVVKNFLEQLLQSPFFLFVLSALAGWVVFVLVHRHFPARAANSLSG